MTDALRNGLNTSWFVVEVDGVQIGTFTEVSGLELEVATETVEEGGENQFVHKLPGRISWPNLRLKRGIIDSNSFFDWVQKSSGNGFARGGNKLQRATAAVVLISSTGERLRSWNLVDAFPVKWTGPTFAAGGSETMSEELEIAHHGFSSG
jgi:phage tail-like protein